MGICIEFENTRFKLYKLLSKDNMEDICGKLEAATPVGTTAVNIHKVHHILTG